MSRRRRLLAWLAIPEHPDPPPGAGASLRTFRASRRFFWYTVAGWVPKQVSAAIGLVVSLAFFSNFDDFIDGPEDLMALLDKIPVPFFGAGEAGLLSLLTFLEWLAVGFFLVQLVASGLLLDLAWKVRWYMVGDESLRIREGLWTVRERTMTIANIQNMSVRQGPIQRLFGIADLEVRTAGGGAQSKGAEAGGEGESKSFHVGRFRGLEAGAARRLRDQLRERLRRHRGAGLGDPDDEEHDAPAEGSAAAGAAASPAAPILPKAVTLVEAARTLRDEAAALRTALASGS